jgi:hypothetical protein
MPAVYNQIHAGLNIKIVLVVGSEDEIKLDSVKLKKARTLFFLH